MSVFGIDRVDGCEIFLGLPLGVQIYDMNEVRMQTSRSGGHKRQKTDIARKDWPCAGPQGSKTVRERLLVCVKTPRSDTDEVDEYEAIVTSELHAQADRAKKLTREEKVASSGGSDRARPTKASPQSDASSKPRMYNGRSSSPWMRLDVETIARRKA